MNRRWAETHRSTYRSRRRTLREWQDYLSTRVPRRKPLSSNKRNGPSAEALVRAIGVLNDRERRIFDGRDISSMKLNGFGVRYDEMVSRPSTDAPFATEDAMARTSASCRWSIRLVRRQCFRRGTLVDK